VSYFPGMAELLHPILMVVERGGRSANDGEACQPEDIAYALMYALITRYTPLLFAEEPLAVQSLFTLFRLLVQYHDPGLCAHLDEHLMRPEVYAQPWLMLLMAASCGDGDGEGLGGGSRSRAGSSKSALKSTDPALAAPAAAETLVSAPTPTSTGANHPPAWQSVALLWDCYLTDADPFLNTFVALSLLTSRRRILMETGSMDALRRALKRGGALSPADGSVLELIARAKQFQAVTPRSFRKQLNTVSFRRGELDPAFYSSVHIAFCMSVSGEEVCEAVGATPPAAGSAASTSAGTAVSAASATPAIAAITAAAAAAAAAAKGGATPSTAAASAAPSAAAAGTPASSTPSTAPPPPKPTPAEATSLNLIVLDARPQEQFDAGRLAVATHVDPDAVPDSQTLRRFVESLRGFLGEQPGKRVAPGSHPSLEMVPHLVFLGGGGDDIDDAFMRKIVLDCIERWYPHVCVVLDGYRGVHAALAAAGALDSGLVDHDPAMCLECTPLDQRPVVKVSRAQRIKDALRAKRAQVSEKIQEVRENRQRKRAASDAAREGGGEGDDSSVCETVDLNRPLRKHTLVDVSSFHNMAGGGGGASGSRAGSGSGIGTASSNSNSNINSNGNGSSGSRGSNSGMSSTGAAGHGPGGPGGIALFAARKLHRDSTCSMRYIAVGPRYLTVLEAHKTKLGMGYVKAHRPLHRVARISFKKANPNALYFQFKPKRTDAAAPGPPVVECYIVESPAALCQAVKTAMERLKAEEGGSRGRTESVFNDVSAMSDAAQSDSGADALQRRRSSRAPSATEPSVASPSIPAAVDAAAPTETALNPSSENRGAVPSSAAPGDAMPVPVNTGGAGSADSLDAAQDPGFPAVDLSLDQIDNDDTASIPSPMRSPAAHADVSLVSLDTPLNNAQDTNTDGDAEAAQQLDAVALDALFQGLEVSPTEGPLAPAPATVAAEKAHDEPATYTTNVADLLGDFASTPVKPESDAASAAAPPSPANADGPTAAPSTPTANLVDLL
jgi:hypothetical protein